MKKKYITPKVEIIIFENSGTLMTDVIDSVVTDPFDDPLYDENYIVQ